MAIYLLIITLAIVSIGKWLLFAPVALIICYRNRQRDAIISYPIQPTYQIETRGVKASNSIKARLSGLYNGFVRYYDLEIGEIPSHHIRNFIYRYIFHVHLSENAVIYYGAEIRDHSKLYIGKGSIIGDKAILDARNGIEIGENVNFKVFGLNNMTTETPCSDAIVMIHFE